MMTGITIKNKTLKRDIQYSNRFMNSKMKIKSNMCMDFKMNMLLDKNKIKILIMRLKVTAIKIINMAIRIIIIMLDLAI